MTASFETDLEPGTGFPRIRFRFANGWSVSLRIATGPDRIEASQATVSAAPTAAWGVSVAELLEIDATADEAIRAIVQVARRRPVEATAS